MVVCFYVFHGNILIFNRYLYKNVHLEEVNLMRKEHYNHKRKYFGDLDNIK